MRKGTIRTYDGINGPTCEIVFQDGSTEELHAGSSLRLTVLGHTGRTEQRLEYDHHAERWYLASEPNFMIDGLTVMVPEEE